MKPYSLKCLLMLIMAAMACPAVGHCFDHALSLSTGQQLTKRQLLAALENQSVVLVGEHHTDPSHHAAQLAVIRMMHTSGIDVAIGMEMFRKDSQAVLDRWVAGQLREADFKTAYRDNWNYDWSLYRPIFIYARQQGIPMIGLNVPREITRQVARHGFSSLSGDQKAALDDITCDITGAYRDFVVRAYGGHGHGNMNFEYFCQAQLVWDTAMATGIIGYMARHPDTVMVVIAGAGHARKPGVPARIAQRSSLSVSVLLPETPGSMDTRTLGPADADYLLVDRMRSAR